MQGEFRWPIVAERRSDLGLRDEFEEDEEEEGVVESENREKDGAYRDSRRPCPSIYHSRP